MHGAIKIVRKYNMRILQNPQFIKVNLFINLLLKQSPSVYK